MRRKTPGFYNDRLPGRRCRKTSRLYQCPTPRPSACIATAPASPSLPPSRLGWMHTARFLTTAPQLRPSCRRSTCPKIAFVGRSNAGKSTCINTLTQQKRLAFASKTPGRTQNINLFTLGKQGVTDAVLADLPGYGYAAVPKQDKIRWQQVMANYLVTRENLRGVVLLCDPRHGLTELDDILLEVIRPRVEEGLKFLVLLTKADKLNRTEADQGAVDRATAGRRRRGETVLGPQAPGRGGDRPAAVAVDAPATRPAE